MRDEREWEDRVEALRWAATEKLLKKGRKWLLTRLWQQQQALARMDSDLVRAEAALEQLRARERDRWAAKFGRLQAAALQLKVEASDSEEELSIEAWDPETHDFRQEQPGG